MSASDRPPENPTAASVVAMADYSHAIHQNLFNISPDGIVVTDSAGIIRDANPRAAELFGYTQQELVGLKVEALVPERFRRSHPRHRENYEAHPRTRQMGAALNLFGLRKDSTEFPVDIMLKPIQTEAGPLTLSFIRDATEQRAAQEALRQHDQQMRALVEGVRDHAIYLLDKDGNIVTWNEGGERLKGYSSDEILGAHFSRFFTPEDIQRGRPARLLELAAQRGRHEEEGWRVRKNGTRFWANIVLTAVRDSAGNLTGFAKVTRDFTDRKRAEEALMLQLSTVLLSNMDVTKLLEAISASVVEVIPHDAATLALYNPDTNQLNSQFLGGESGRIGDIALPLHGSPGGEAFTTQQPVIVRNMAASGYDPAGVEHLTGLGMRSACWVPLIDRHKTIGALAVASRNEGTFTEQDAELLLQVAGRIAMAVNNALAFRRIGELRDRLSQEKQYLEEEINLDNRFEDIVGESSGLRQVLKDIETVAPTDATVLIQGETGTGKELLARAIHRLSSRSDRTFIKLNCAAIPAGLLESELFGHEKGAFTGAIARKMGRLELAHEGTLFLDEVGEMPLDLQPKLLRALQEREIERLGGTRPISVNVRLIAATNRDLAQMVAEKTFRSDLFYRLKVFPIFAPPLRDRSSDIPALVRHFVSTHSRRMGKVIDTIPADIMEALQRWAWPGNIRELENFLERAVILTRGRTLYAPLAELKSPEAQESTAAATDSPTLQSAERDHIIRVLRETHGQIAGDDGAAARLGLKRTTLNSKMQKLGIKRSDYA